MVDGAAVPGTRITLSHWPHSGTPWPLKDDLSSQIVFKYLKNPAFHVDASAVTNTHFDTDGLVGLWAVLHPEQALTNETLLNDIAAAGDFQKFSDWQAYRIACIVAVFSDPSRSPLSKEVFAGSYPEQCGKQYQALLELLPEFIRQPEKYRQYWHEAEDKLRQAETALAEGTIKLREVKELSLAVFEGVGDLPAEALHRATDCTTIAVIRGRKLRAYDRYETWVQFVSRPLRQRRDFRPLAEKLNVLETTGGRWSVDGPDGIVPSLSLEGREESSVEPAEFEELLKRTLAEEKPAWDPFDRRPA
jgi:hypothetical protein